MNRLTLDAQLAAVFAAVDDCVELVDTDGKSVGTFVPPQRGKFTSPRPILDIAKAIPGLAALARRAIRLHPRRGRAGSGESKIGGQLFWPDDDPWPVCETHGLPYSAILQVRADNLPAHADIPFPPGRDTLQLLWCARSHEDGFPAATVRWRTISEVHCSNDHPQIEWNPDDFPDDEGFFLPQECMLHPEVVTEYPAFHDLPLALKNQVRKLDLSSVLEALKARDDWRDSNDARDLYHDELSTAPGCKLAGHPHWIQNPAYPTCACGKKMEHLLTLADHEPAIGRLLGTLHKRWWPVQASHLHHDEAEQQSRAIGWALGSGGSCFGFVCRSCAHWPVTFVWQSG